MESIKMDPSLDEIGNIDRMIRKVQDAGIVTGPGSCDHGKFEALRRVVKQHFNVPWTSISAPMERLLYAISATQQPANMVCLGIFCGNTLIWNIGSACGPGKCYEPDHLVGVEIEEESTKIAKSNLELLGVLDSVELLTEDAHDTIDRIDYPIDLLYLDATGKPPGPKGKKIYFTLLQRAYDKIPEGGLVIGHGTLPERFIRQAGDYLNFVRNKAHFRDSASLEPDNGGIELSVK
ncbi:hypothetical protein ACFL6S_25575 [Candidatus Poribacteria bacterium]